MQLAECVQIFQSHYNIQRWSDKWGFLELPQSILISLFRNQTKVSCQIQQNPKRKHLFRFKAESGHLTVLQSVLQKRERKWRKYTFTKNFKTKCTNNILYNLVIVANINAWVDSNPVQNIIGMYGEEHLNETGKTLKEFVTFNMLRLTNT